MSLSKNKNQILVQIQAVSARTVLPKLIALHGRGVIFGSWVGTGFAVISSSSTCLALTHTHRISVHMIMAFILKETIV